VNIYIYTVSFRKKNTGKGIEIDVLTKTPITYLRHKLDRDYMVRDRGIPIPKVLWLALVKQEQTKYLVKRPLD
jgi:hypothetical protein